MKFLYISTGNKYPPDKHLIDGLKENGHNVFELTENKQGLFKYTTFTHDFLKNKYSFDCIIVGYGLSFFVPIVRFISLKKIIFNAVSSHYEANIISRSTDGPWSLVALKWWLIDFISFNLSSLVLLESNAQINFIHKTFLISKKKLIKSWMGVDEEVFFKDSNIEKEKEFTVLFRGRFLPESGILTVIETAKKLEDKDIKFRIIGEGFMYKEVNSLMNKLKPGNIDFINKPLPTVELREKMLSCNISLGQLAIHDRLLRTIPAKLYESLALGLPYLTGRNKGVLELLSDGENCITVEPGNSDDLAEKILYLKNNPEIFQKVADKGYNLYKEKLTSKQLAKDFISNCFKK